MVDRSMNDVPVFPPMTDCRIGVLMFDRRLSISVHGEGRNILVVLSAPFVYSAGGPTEFEPPDSDGRWPRQAGLLMDLLQELLTSVTITARNELELAGPDWKITAPPTPLYESWEINDSSVGKVICLADGELAIFGLPDD